MRNLAVVLTAVAFGSMSVNSAIAAEIYNKDANKLDLYGKVDGLHYFSGNPSDNGDKSYVRLGFKGETQINNDITGYGQWEYQFNTNRPDNDDKATSPQGYTRIAFAGLSFGQAGSFDYGRNYGVLYDIGAWTDMLPEFGDDSYESSDNFMTGRSNNLATYRNQGFFGLVDGLNLAIQYQGKNDGCGTEFSCDDKNAVRLSNNSRDIEGQNGDGLGMSLIYNFGGGFGAGAAYSNSNRTTEQKTDGNGNKAEAWTAGLKYDANSIYLAANYTQTHNMTWVGIADNSRFKDIQVTECAKSGSGKCDGYGGAFINKTDNWELVAQYQFDFGLRPSIAYLQSRARDTGIGKFDAVKYADIGASYSFNKNMSAYVDYKINLLKNNNPAGLNTDDIVATGLVYQF
jgi:predicted porin